MYNYNYPIVRYSACRCTHFDRIALRHCLDSLQRIYILMYELELYQGLYIPHLLKRKRESSIKRNY